MPDRNYESRFSRVPTLNQRRSRFKQPHLLSTTLRVGNLTPIFCKEIIPGDTFKIDTNKFVRMNVPLYPIMDNLYLDTYFFFVPNRLVWDHWEQFCGANDDPWVNNVTYSIPVIDVDQSADSSGNTFTIEPESILDYLGLPLFDDNKNSQLIWSFNALPIRALGLIWNNYFRDQNTMAEIPVFTGDQTVTIGVSGIGDETLGYDVLNPNVNVDADHNIARVAGNLKVSKFHDYFTSLSLAPQKGPEVLVPASGYVSLMDPAKAPTSVNTSGPSFGAWNPTSGTYAVVTSGSAGGSTATFLGQNPTRGNALTGNNTVASNINYRTSSGPYTGGGLVYNPAGTLGFDNLQITINDLRMAAVMQQWEEVNARSGSRYKEYLLAHYGVTTPDSRLQIPEYCGGDRIQLNMQDVEQTSATTTTPLGAFAGKSTTYHREHSVFKSFTEHGFLIGVCCIRPDQTYSGGLEAMWNRKEIFDYYDPLFANIGDMPVYLKELGLHSINTSSGPEIDERIFGYKEAWAEYRYSPNKITGKLRPELNNGLHLWTYAEDILGEMAQGDYLDYDWYFLEQRDHILTRNLAAGASAPYQFVAQFYFDTIATRPMPLYSVPGLKRF